MKNKKRFLLGFGLLTFIVVLGVGYATVTHDLNVTGTANALPNNSFDVFFTAASADASQTVTATSTASTTSGTKVATMSVDLTNLNETQTATFTVKNNSESGIAAHFTDADIKICTHDSYNTSTNTCTAFTSDYFTVTKDVSNLTSANLASQATATFTVTVALKKVNAGLVDENSDDIPDNHTETFDVILGEITPVQE